MKSKYSCRECGDELPKMLVDGPVAGEGTDTDAVELCGGCEADVWIKNTKD